MGTPVPKAAEYIYELNFFGGFIVASTVYWSLCRAFPIPACSDRWLEVGDEISDVSLAYGEDGDVVGIPTAAVRRGGAATSASSLADEEAGVTKYGTTTIDKDTKDF